MLDSKNTPMGVRLKHRTERFSQPPSPPGIVREHPGLIGDKPRGPWQLSPRSVGVCPGMTANSPPLAPGGHQGSRPWRAGMRGGVGPSARCRPPGTAALGRDGVHAVRGRVARLIATVVARVRLIAKLTRCLVLRIFCDC